MKPKVGRPRLLESAKRRNIYIPDALWAKAEQLGSGSAAEGIRIALTAYKPKRQATSQRTGISSP